MSIESRLKTVRRNTGNHKSESAMSKENLKKNKKNYWFSITLIALALFCVGAALLYSQKLLGEKLSTPKSSCCFLHSTIRLSFHLKSAVSQA